MLVSGRAVAGVVCNLVIVRSFRILPDVLVLRFFNCGPEDAEGDAWRERVLGVKVAEVVCDVL